MLDLGIGMGFYGAVCRQWNDEGAFPWGSYLVGVEAHEGYRNPQWTVYDEIRIEDIRARSWANERWDLVILSDMLEHLDFSDGYDAIATMKSSLTADGELFVATPGWFMPQEAVHGNAHEVHRSVWTPAQLVRLGFTILHDGTIDVFGGAMLQAYYDPRRQ